MNYPGNSNSPEFEITAENVETGIVTLAQRVDYERVTSYNVTVLAVDSGVPPLSSTALIRVSVEDVNDNAPVWVTDFSQPFEVWENESIGNKPDCTCNYTQASRV